MAGKRRVRANFTCDRSQYETSRRIQAAAHPSLRATLSPLSRKP